MEAKSWRRRPRWGMPGMGLLRQWRRNWAWLWSEEMNWARSVNERTNLSGTETQVCLRRAMGPSWVLDCSAMRAEMLLSFLHSSATLITRVSALERSLASEYARMYVAAA